MGVWDLREVDVLLQSIICLCSIDASVPGMQAQKKRDTFP